MFLYEKTHNIDISRTVINLLILLKQNIVKLEKFAS